MLHTGLIVGVLGFHTETAMSGKGREAKERFESVNQFPTKPSATSWEIGCGYAAVKGTGNDYRFWPTHPPQQACEMSLVLEHGLQNLFESAGDPLNLVKEPVVAATDFLLFKC